LIDYSIVSGKGKKASATVKISNEKGKVSEATVSGNGTVNAAYAAIEKLTGIAAELETYTVSAASDGMDALGEVTVRLLIDGQSIAGRGLSTDVIEASILAYLNAINKK